MYLVVDGWFRPVLLPNGDSIVRFLPSDPTARLFSFNLFRVVLSSWIGEIVSGNAFAFCRNVSSLVQRAPDSSLGQGILLAFRNDSNRAILNVVSSNNAFVSKEATNSALKASQLPFNSVSVFKSSEAFPLHEGCSVAILPSKKCSSQINQPPHFVQQLRCSYDILLAIVQQP